jgi:hypothetical protein
MPALPADIAAGTRPAAIETWSDAAIKARYPSARDGGVQPAEGFCDLPANALTIITARAALFGVERRRFRAGVQDLLWPDPASGIPIISLTDAEQAIAGKILPARIELDGEKEATSYEGFG